MTVKENKGWRRQGKVEDLDIFRLSHELTLQIYKVTGDFPDEERFGLIPRMRRSAASIPANLMEGGCRVPGISWFYETFPADSPVPLMQHQGHYRNS